ncbi:MAG: proton-conducting transporter membrane subunit, partial [Verrucomicrobiota bacterium]
MDLLLPIVPILCSMLFAILALIVREHPRRSRAVLLAGASANLAAALAVLHRVTDTGVPLTVAMGGWSEPVGIGFRVDLLSAVMITVTGVVGLAGAAFAVTELGRSTWRRGYGLFFFLLLTGIHGAFLTNDLFNLFVWFEVMLMASFAMLILGRRKFVFEGATRYVVINMISSFFFLTGLGILYGKTGQLNLSVLADLLAASGDDPLILSSSAFLIIAFGIKAGAFPLFFWLPPAYPNTGFATAAVFGGLLTKVGVYALFRVFGGAFGFLAPVTAPIFLAVALATMVTGVLGAASQFRVRRILSFHIVSQIGYILLGLGLFSQGAFAAAIFYTV